MGQTAPHSSPVSHSSHSSHFFGRKSFVYRFTGVTRFKSAVDLGGLGGTVAPQLPDFLDAAGVMPG